MHKVTFILLVIGGLNWLLFAIFKNDIFSWIFAEAGMTHWVARVVYGLVGLSALYEIFTHKAKCRDCMSKSAPSGAPAMGSSSMGSSSM